jgi:hypothetical protein
MAIKRGCQKSLKFSYDSWALHHVLFYLVTCAAYHPCYTAVGGGVMRNGESRCFVQPSDMASCVMSFLISEAVMQKYFWDPQLMF